VFYLANAKKVAVTQKPKLTKTELKVADYISKYKAKEYSEKDIKNALLKSGVKPMTITKMMNLSKSKSKKPLHKSAWLWSLLILGVIAVVLLLLFFPSCETELECYADVDCDFGMECVDGVCLDTGDDIPVVDDTECYYDSDCPTDYECVESYCVEEDDDNGAEPECGDGSCDVGEDCWEDCGCDNDDDCPEDYECEDDTCVEEDDGSSGGGSGGGGGGDGGDGTSPECGTNDDCVEEYYCDDVGTCTDVGSTCCDCMDNGVYNWSLDANCLAVSDNHKAVCELDIIAEDCVDTQPAEDLACDGETRCDDGCDNDGDNLVDYGVDRGCYRPTDDNERVDCQDGWDNDGDGLVDLDDEGCSSYADKTEDIIETRCNDGLDNDGDGDIDMNDNGCLALSDDDERIECDDGLDNDKDGLMDLKDPDCYSASDDSEYEVETSTTPLGIIIDFVFGGLNL